MPVQRFGSGGVYEEQIGYSRVVVASDGATRTGWTAGTTALVNGRVAHPGDAYGQAMVALQSALFALERAGFTRADTVAVRMHVVNLATNAPAVGRAHAAILGEIRPASSMLGVAALIDPALLVEVELTAWRGDLDPAA